MPPHAALRHVTQYRYDRPVQLGPQLVRLRPAPHGRSRVLSYALTVDPDDAHVHWHQDPYANYQARLMLPQRTTRFQITVDLTVELAPFNPFEFFLEPGAVNFPFGYEPALAQALAPYRVAAPATPRLQDYLARIDRTPQPSVAFLVDLNRRLRADIQYLRRHEPGVQTPEETLARGSGSCRDSSWLLVQVLRHLGLAARFVSGYLIELVPSPAPGHELHAWCEVYLPGAGWLGLDPTSGLVAGEGHIPLACTPEPASAAPVEGLLEPAGVEFTHHLQVTHGVATGSYNAQLSSSEITPCPSPKNSRN
jgi:transglutaminase-like putative cysteine protease